MTEEIGTDYGPLTRLIGTWEGDKGIDVAPGPESEARSAYFETLMFSAIGDVTNAQSQVLAVLHYRQIVRRKSDGEIFHDETGYWMWDAVTQTIIHSLVIPRGVAVLAGGRFENQADPSSPFTLEVSASIDDPAWSILQSPFMMEKARTTKFTQKLVIDDSKLSFSETTTLDIYGKTFEHTDDNTLTRRDH